MTAVVLAALGVLSAAAAVLWLPAVSRRVEATPWWLVAGVPAVALGAVAVAAWIVGSDASPRSADVAAALAVVVAVLGGGPVATAVLRGAERSGLTGVSYPVETIEPVEQAAGTTLTAPRNVAELRGGLWIGALERAGVVVSLLVGQPGGLALVVAVKGLGRYPELRAAGAAAAERFIIGTFTSFLWAAAAAGVALLLS